MNAINTRAAAAALLVTIASLAGVSRIADSEHRQVLVAAEQSATLAAAAPAVQQVVIVGRRAKV